jgi:hypothetical protein
MAHQIRRFLAAVICTALLGTVPAPALASEAGVAQMGSEIFDLLVGRPTLFMATVAGSIYWVLTLPITAAGGQSDQAWDQFVAEPSDKLVGPLGGTKG